MKAEPIKQDTAPPLMMYGRDSAKLDDLSWDAHGLFWSAQLWLINGGNDYVMSVPKRKLATAAGRRAPLKRLENAAAELVDEKVWADVGDAWEVLLHHQPDIDVWRSPTARARWLRDKALRRDTDLLNRIKDRDRLLCRYCGVRTRWDNDQRSRVAGTYDHVDPDGGNTFDNVVIACRHCNCTLKKDRTLEHAGMSLYRPGTTAEDISAGRARKVVAASGAQSAIPERKARSDPDWPGQEAGADPDPIPIRPGSAAGSARAPARLRTEPDPIPIRPGSDQRPQGGGSDAPFVPWSDAEIESSGLYPSPSVGGCS